jgi:hypothetical protein
MASIPTLNSNRTLGTSPASHGTTSPGKMTNNVHRFAYSPNPSHPPRIFDGTMFLLDPHSPNSVSQPLRPALPNMSSPAINGASARSPSVSCTAPSPTDSGATPDSHASYGSSGYLDPRSSSSPSSHDMMSGISGSTTPGFETLEDLPEGFPDLGDEVMFRINSLPTVNIPDQEDERIGIPLNSAGSSGYPPSPRLTASPHPAHMSPKVTISRTTYNSSIVKIEHPTPVDHQSPYSSSSSSGMAEDNTTIRRGDDGSWRGGIDPSGRGGEYLPFSLKEQEFERMKQAKNADVEEWLRRSAQQLPRQPTTNGLTAPKDGRRRAKSVSDFRASEAFVDGKTVSPVLNGASSVNGIVINDDDDDDDSSVASVDSAWKEGSLDEQTPPDVEKEHPPTDEDLKMTEADEELLQKERENDPAFLPKPRQFFGSHPWNDIVGPVSRGATMTHRNQPSTANAAIMKFRRYADNIETASRVATFGSNMTKGRRNSAGDADKVLPGPLKRLSFGRDKDKDKNKNGAAPTRRPSIWGGFRSGLKRSLSNAGDKDKDKDRAQDGTGENGKEKEKEKEKDNNRLQSPVEPGRKRGRSFSGLNSSSPFAQGILGPAFGQPSLQVQTTNIGSAFAQMASPLMAAGAGANKPATSNGVAGVVNRIRRNRSKSDLQRKHIFGVVTSLVGPALPASPPEKEITPGRIEKKFTFGEESQKRGVEGARKLLSPDDARREGDDDDMDDGDFSPQTARTPGGTKAQLPKHEIIPTLDGFAQNVRILAPGLSQKLVDRIAHEQCKRFKKLVDHRHKHLTAIKSNRPCTNGAKCRKVFGAIGVGSDGVVGVTGHKRGNNCFDGDDHGRSHIIYIFTNCAGPELC